MPIPHLPVHRASAPRARRHRKFGARVRTSIAGVATAGAVAVALTVSLGTGSAQASNHIVIGASGDASALQSHVGAPLARHVYGKLSGPARVGQLVNIESTTSWSAVASGSQDANIKRWAAALKGKNVMVSFSHEPMSKHNSHMGTSASFVAAWKHMVNVFNAAGATDVLWVWNVTSDSFRVKSTDPRYGAKWYPGDAYVDYVAGEAYNRYGCGGQPNTSLADKIKDIFAFAGQHGKKFVVAEFASNAFSGRAAWINAAHAFMDANKTRFAGAFYYDPTSAQCHWHLTSSAEFAAIKSLATDSGFGA